MSEVNGTDEMVDEVETQAVALQEQRLPAADKHRARDIKIGKRGITFDNAADVMAYARMMSDSDLAVPHCLRHNPGACLAVIDDAIRFGLSPYALARETYVVKNKEGVESIAYMAKAVAGIIIANAPIAKRPKVEYEGVGGELKCVVTFTLRNGDEIRHESPEWKDIKVKNSPLWFSDPKQQLGYYTLRSGGRLHFSDVLMGLYDGDELTELDVAPNRLERPAEPATSGLASRLPGPAQTGFSEEHVATELNGDENEAGPLVAPEDDREVIADLEALLKTSKTPLEVAAVASQAEAAIAGLSYVGKDLARRRIAEREAAVATLKKRRR